MMPGLVSSAEPQGWRSHPDGDHINKGLLAEHWDNTGRVKIRVNALALNEIRDVLRFDPDFVICSRRATCLREDI